MFPNARLVVVAMLASIVAVSCGLGVFAAFRVNHQPFTRLQSADPPLQLVFGSGAPAPVKDVSAAPFGVRFLLNAPVAVPETVAAVSIQQAPAAAPDAAIPVPVSPADPAPAATTDSQPSPTSETPAPVAAISSDQEPPQQSAQQAGGADNVALTSLPDQTSTAVPAVRDTQAAPDETKTSVTPSGNPAAKAAAKPARKEAARHGVGVRRIRRTQPADAAQWPGQSFALAPAYQAIPDRVAQQAPQVVRRRVVVKRHRSATKAAAQAPAANQTPANGPALATSRQ
jgi:hypothetical protein